MTKKEITVFSYLSILIYGAGLAFIAYHLPFILGIPPSFNNLSADSRDILILWICYFFQFIGLIGMVGVREWGRQLFIAAAFITIFYILASVFLERRVLEISVWSALGVSFLLAIFFQRSSVRKIFQYTPPSSKKILVIDDDRGLLVMLKSNLTKNGFSVMMAQNGEQGLELARQKKPDIILLDVIMPKMKGREVCARLKKDETTRSIPVIFLTAKDSPDDIHAELELGAVSHITKPVDYAKLLAEIHAILR